MSFPTASEVTEDDYIEMVGGKTSALFRGCAEVGAIVGGGTSREIKALGGFVYDAGIAFQIVDDILGVTADEKTLGKPVGSDIREGKKTIIMLHALRHAKAGQAKRLNAVLGNRQAIKEDLLEAEGLLKEIGSVDYASRKADKYLAQGKKRIRSLPDSEAKRSLLELVDYFTQRNY
jgi:geranylgeranyl diphosphate synthase type I